MYNYSTQTPKNSNIKKTISWALGVPLAILAMTEVDTLSLWYVPILAMAGLTALLAWNGAFNQESEQRY